MGRDSDRWAGFQAASPDGTDRVGAPGAQWGGQAWRKPLRARVALPLVGAVLVHVAFAALIVEASRHVMTPELPSPEMIEMVFESPTPPAAPLAAAEPPAPEPPQAVEPPPPPEISEAEAPPPETPEPPPLPELPPLPAPKPPEPKPLQHQVRPHPPSRPPAFAQHAPDRPVDPALERAPPLVTPAPAAPPAVEISPGWRSGLGTWIEAHKSYPESARRRGEEGRVVVRFTADRDGRVLDVALLQSSGSHALDAATEALLRGAHLPPFPSAMTQLQVTVTLPVTYRLEQ